MRHKANGAAPRVLLSLLGVALILWGIGNLVLGVVGERDTAVITSIRRQGGERAEAKPNRYTYQIGYTFTLPDGRQVDGYTTRIGNAVFVKASGTSTAPVRYLKAAPFVNTLEENTKLTLGQPILMAAGTFLIVAMNRRRKTDQENDSDEAE